MLRIAPELVESVRAATAPEDLHGLVQNAIMLEHATIPTYLCAYFTIKPGTNLLVADILRSVVIEEMLHMTMMSNLLIAIGGAPAIDDPKFIPEYPGPLPMNLGDSVRASLRQCSIDQIRDVFMEIEAPEVPLEFPKAEFALAEPPKTIGEFYEALAEKLAELGQGAFIGDFSREVVAPQWFGAASERIVDVATANAAIELIRLQGEGTPLTPEDPEGALAHYYRFRQIVEGRALVKDSSVKQGWSYSGEPIALDTANIWNMVDDPKARDYPPGSRARVVVDNFNASYSSLLRALHRCFNGDPDHLDAAIGLMYDMRLAAQDVLETLAPSGTGQCGLTFEYMPA